MHAQTRMLRGLVFGVLISVPLWMSLIGWMQLL